MAENIVLILLAPAIGVAALTSDYKDKQEGAVTSCTEPENK